MEDPIVIIDEYIVIEKSLYKTLLREAHKVIDGDYSKLEARILGMGGQLPPYIDDITYPTKDCEEPVPKHNAHPKAKAKLPFYHQRRRF